MPPQAVALTCMLDDPCFIHRSHKETAENRFPKVVL